MCTTRYDEVCRELLEYVSRANFNSYRGEISTDTPLLKSGIIDSLSMMTCILFLERTYGLDFFTTEITRQDFTSIATLAALVTRQLTLSEVSP